MQAARIWMTGAGLVTSLGDNLEATWTRLVRGERAIGPIDLFDTSGLRATSAAQVRGLVTQPGWSRTDALAFAAAREAVASAGLDIASRRVGLVVGGTTGGMYENEALLAELHVDPHGRTIGGLLSHPLTSTGDRLHDALGPFVRVRTLCSACSSGANAFLVAALWLLAGEVDAVLAGGTDGLCRLTYSGFNALQAIDSEPCRPFDVRRGGLNLGEGAGFAVFERASTAGPRGAKPMAELAGWAARAEAHHITNPEPTGATAARTIALALARAGLAPNAVDYVNAHGTATPLNDPMESAALGAALGEEIRRVPVSSSKGQIGHTLAAAGAIEGILAALAVQRQELPPTAGLDDPDPACGLVHVPHVGQKARVRAALSDSFGFGGMDTALLFSELELGPGHGATQRSVVVTGAAALSAAGVDDATTAGRLAQKAASPGSDKGGRLDLDLSAHLDVARARRLDRAARLAAIVCERAMVEARGARELDRLRTGVILGSSFGSVDPSAAFMHRLFEKGARFASPAEFPNLVPSSPVGHASIYLGVHGPVLSTADLAASGESAIAQGVELVTLGEADVVVAGAAEEASAIIAEVLAGLFARASDRHARPRGEGAGAIVLEAEDTAKARGAAVLARLVERVAWRDGVEDPLRGVASPRDPSRARVVMPRENGGADALLEGSAWRSVERVTCAPQAGDHEALGAVAAVVGVALLRQGVAAEVLVLGLAKGRGYAIVLASP